MTIQSNNNNYIKDRILVQPKTKLFCHLSSVQFSFRNEFLTAALTEQRKSILEKLRIIAVLFFLINLLLHGALTPGQHLDTFPSAKAHQFSN